MQNSNTLPLDAEITTEYTSIHAIADNNPTAPMQVGFTTDLAELPHEGGVDPAFGTITWRTLISGENGRSDGVVLGVATCGPNGCLHLHRHDPAEFYLGLSGSGRLHDLFVRWEAMSPGEFAYAGKGLTIYWGWFESHFGPALVMGTDRGICGLAFAAEAGPEPAMTDLKSRWPKAVFIEDKAFLRDWATAALGMTGETQLHMIGAPFQLKVWEALLTIPSGHVTTYSEIAQSIGKPKAVRAVGTAVGRNPVSWLIPCHRALRKSGALGGYHWGLPVKRAMLAWESARVDAQPPQA